MNFRFQSGYTELQNEMLTKWQRSLNITSIVAEKAENRSLGVIKQER